MPAQPNPPAPSSGGLQYMQTQSQALKNSVGTEQNWGWSPGFDLLEHIPRGRLDGDLEEPVRVLVDSPGDVRHLMYTVSRVRRHTERPVEIYVQEGNLKHYARHVFFLVWFMERGVGDIGENDVAEFLELYGSSLLRDSAEGTMRRLGRRAANILRGGADKLAGYFDFETFAKMKEVDWVADQLDAWSNKNTSFNVDVQWDNRIRSDIGDRYDSKENIMDWDFNMGLLPYTPHVRWPEYKDWRTTGVAYDWERVNPRKGVKYTYTHPNKTLAMFINRKRDTGVYLGDVRCSPYANFGIDTEYPDLTVKQHDGSFKYSNGVLALHAVRALLYEYVTGKPWEYKEFKLAWDAPDYTQDQPRVEEPPPRPNVKFIFAGLDPERFHLLLNTKTAEPIKFDAMFLSCHAAQNFTEARKELLKPTGYLAIETVKYCVYMDAAQKAAFTTKVTELATSQGWSPCAPLQSRLHRNAPKWRLPFARTENPTLTEAQAKEKAKHESPWVLAFVNTTANPSPEWSG
eukprot:TRINITY_DN1014_c0_g2_i1.p1 TRINITY_DN1014_c0_g2~~TRINITY_DN1014_c0_g2_i1.p1  ORF type:complete len:515 (+),score=69.33 TRINITY_DN1014_c0_g2_i1:50-1594(+)